MLHSRPNIEILEDLDSSVCGHTDAKKALISLVNRSKIRHHQKWIQKIHKDHLVKPHKCLLIGQSGTGKTHLLESLHEILDFPLIRLDATKLNPTGASGGIKQDDLEKLIYKKALEYCETKRGYYHSVEGTVDQMVVFIDEIDKLGKSFDSSGNWNNHIQANFLTMFDHKAEFAGVSFIFAGAFNDITKNEIVKANLGFMKSCGAETKEIDQRIVEAGLIPELVGRLTQIVELDKFTIEDYRHILKTVILPRKRIEMAYFNIVEIELSDYALDKMAKIAYNSGQGIRSLHRQLEKEFLDLEFDYEEHKYCLGYDGGYDEC